MKKIFTWILTIFSLFALVACGSAPVYVEFEADKPWETQTLYEKATYTVNRYRMVKSGKETVRDGDPIATGELTTVVREGAAAADEGATVDIETTFTVTYEDSERAGVDRGLTDTIETRLTCRKVGLGPLSSYRKVVLAPRADQTDLSYTVTGDYVNGTAEMLKSGEETPQSITLSTSGTVFDNEQLYFVARALKGLAPKSSNSITLINLHDCFLNGFSTYPMTVSCAEEKETLYIGEWATALGLESDGNGSAKVECLRVSIGKNDNFPGPPQTVYYANQNFQVNATETTSRVLVSIVNREYDASATESFNTVYTLSSYTTTP